MNRCLGGLRVGQQLRHTKKYFSGGIIIQQSQKYFWLLQQLSIISIRIKKT